MVKKIFNSRYYAPSLLAIAIISLFYQFFIFGKIPFPGDLLVASYAPWFEYFKMPVKNPLISDVFSQFILWKYLSIDQIKSLQWPLWDPYSFTGTPLLATYHSATLYPINIVLFLPKYFGWGLFIFFQTLLAAINFYILLTLWVRSKIARIAGSVIFSLGGLMTTWLEFGTAVHAIAWLPLAFYCVEKFRTSLKVKYLILLIISLTFLLLAGNAQISTYAFITLVFYSFFTTFNANFKYTLLHLFPIIISILFSVFVSSIQLLPSLDLFQKSIRLTEAYIEESNFGLLHTKDTFKFFIADFFGNPVTRNYWGRLNYSETSPFVGSLTLTLLIFSYAFLKKNKVSAFFLTLLPISLLFSFDNPISKAIYESKLPFLTSSYASRVLFITNFSIAVISAFALNQLLTRKEELNKLLKATLWGLAIFLGIILGIKIVQIIIEEILKIPPESKYLEFMLRDKEYSLSNFSVTLRNTAIPIAITSLFLFLSFVVKKIQYNFFKKNKNVIICSIVTLLIFLDLARYFLKFNPFVHQNLIFPKTPVLDFLQNQKSFFRIGREHAEILPPNTWAAYGLQTYEGYNPIYLNQYGKFMHFLNGGDIRTGNSSRYAELTGEYKSPYLDAANVKYFTTILRDQNGKIPGDLLYYKFKETNYREVFRDKSVAILENPDAKDRVFFAKSYFLAPKSQIENTIMTDKNFDPSVIVGLSEDLGIKTITGNGKATIIRYSNNVVEVETQTDSEEILVLADQWDEGWHATIDGSQTKVSPANLIYRAIRIPSGIHKATFYYWPASFDLGIKISFASLAVLMLFTFWSIKRKTF